MSQSESNDCCCGCLSLLNAVIVIIGLEILTLFLGPIRITSSELVNQTMSAHIGISSFRAAILVLIAAWAFSFYALLLIATKERSKTQFVVYLILKTLIIILVSIVLIFLFVDHKKTDDDVEFVLTILSCVITIFPPLCYFYIIYRYYQHPNISPYQVNSNQRWVSHRNYERFNDTAPSDVESYGAEFPAPEISDAESSEAENSSAETSDAENSSAESSDAEISSDESSGFESSRTVLSGAESTGSEFSSAESSEAEL